MNKSRFALLAMLLTSTLALGQAKDFPSGPIKVIVPFPPGSGADTSARFFSTQLAAVLGQPLIVDNRVGANAVIAVMAVRTAPANGYSILMGSSASMVMNSIIIKDLPYDPIKDFRPVSGLTRTVTVFVVPSNSRIRSIAELISAAKTNKEKLNVGTFTASYALGQEWLGNLAGVKFLNVPYKGVGQVFADLMGGQLDFTIVDIASAAPLFPSGKLRALAVSSDKRHVDFPDMPTLVESGFPEYVNYLWNGFYVRADTPNDVTSRLADGLQKVLATNAAKEYAKGVWAEVLPLAPAAMRKYHQDDMENLRRVASAAGIKQE